MSKKETAKIANSDILSEDKLYLKRARQTLPYLVRQAKAGQTIYYSDLASEIGISNPRNLNYVLGAIGNALINLSKDTNVEIPPIQCIVINKQQELPGEGIGWFIKQEDFKKLSKSQKIKVIRAQLVAIYSFASWDWVLEQLNLEPLKVCLKDELDKSKKLKGGGESESHKKFKELIAKNPSVLGLNPKMDIVHIEYELPSADTIDILFIEKDLKIGVEVKSIISDSSDILRGLFQCIKYKHLIEAEQVLNDETPNSKVILALEGALPKELYIAKNLLGIEVIDRIGSIKK